MGNSVPAEKSGGGTDNKKTGLFRVSPYMVIPSRVGGFSLYLRQGESFVLYAEKGQLFTEEHKDRLAELDVDHLYVKSEDYPFYTEYLHENLLNILDDSSIPVRDRARAWNDATVSLAKAAYDRNLPQSLDKERFTRIRKLINNSLKFLARDDALKELSRFIAESNEQFEHGINVMVLTVSVLMTFIEDDSDLLVSVGIGAMLHDIGKLELPEELFRRREGTLSQTEIDLIRSHPALGVGVCSGMPLPQETLQCILFHHEQMDGTGYPGGMTESLLPAYARALILCNEYDNYIRGGPGRKKMTPFEALTRIKSRRSAHDQDMLKRLIAVLSKADLA